VTISKRLAGAITGMLATSLLSVPLLATPAHAQKLAEDRPSVAPSVFFPAVARRAHDLRTAGQRPGTMIKAGCGTKVVAAHPGTAIVSDSRSSGPHLVTIVTTPGRTTTYYGFMKSASVVTGQIIQAGQEIGRVGRKGSAAPNFCALYFAVKNNAGKSANPTRWLNRLVGQPLNSTSLFGNWGFVVASMNTLGASHTRYGGGYPTYDVRTPAQVSLLDSYAVDVVGLQEFQCNQRDLFMSVSAGRYGIYPDDTIVHANPLKPTECTADTENSIIWNNATMELVSEELIDIPYFNGWAPPRKMPVVQLRDRATGRTAYFINVHNPASGVGYGDQAANRASAIATERAKIQELRGTGRPVILTGDFNDRAPAFCGITTQMLAITPDSIPSMGCAMPKSNGIDWIFAAGPVRFTRYARDWKPKNMKLTDHPIVWARAHLSE
jgi:endonuclease/exonuclease/phosphatase family metal-dependent hydrolase